ncbi:MAG: carbohydrate porin [Planctomycetales bacterium]|nr:carbohydrate porin [Planctomycetales bacterium]
MSLTGIRESNLFAKRYRGWQTRLLVVASFWGGACLSVSAQQSAAIPNLPLPQHSLRSDLASPESRPAPARPERSDFQPDPQGWRSGSEFPIPGQPARDLLPPDEFVPEEDPGLFRRLPHSFRDGAISIEYVYTGETFTKATGGLNRNHITNYRSNLDIVALVDTEGMGWWNGGRFFIYGESLAGRPISTTDVGDYQLFSNIDSTISDTERPSFTAIAEYWYEHYLLDGDLRFKIGKQDANADFAYTDLGGDFVHSSFGLVPNCPMPTFPSQTLGVATFAALTDTFNVGLGVYDGTLSDGPTGVRWGFDTLGHNAAMSLFQLEWMPQFGSEGELPNTTRFGMWHHSAKDVWTEIVDTNPRTFNQNYGLWFIVDQMLWKENGAADAQGLGVFFQYGWAPRNRNELSEYYGAGLVYKGLLPSRDDDLLGIGVANALFSPDFRSVSIAAGDQLGPSETAIEVFYKYYCSPFFVLQPDVQFIANPSGLYQDALLPGLRFEILL